MTAVFRQRIAWVAWTAVLIASLTAVYALNRRAIEPSRADEGGDTRFGFRLEESAKAVGVDFVHQAPTFDARLSHIMPQVASMGAGASIVDFDRDGWQDIYVTNSGEGSKNSLYRNLGDGTFKDVAAEVGVADINQSGSGVSMGAVWGASGQVCTCGTRVLVHESIHDKFVDMVIDGSKGIRLGPGLDPASEMGPLVSARQLDRVEGYVRIGREEGAELALTTARAQFLFDVTQAYYDAALAERLVSIAEATLNQAEATFRQVQASFSAGTQPEFELLRARVTRDTQRPVIIRQRANREIARLMAALDRPPGTRTDPTPTVEAQHLDRNRRTGRIDAAALVVQECPHLAPFGAGDDAKRPSVQVGNPFLEKLLMEACLELAEQHGDWIEGLQDLGAAGLTIALFPGCFTDRLYPEQGEAIVATLRAAGAQGIGGGQR